MKTSFQVLIVDDHKGMKKTLTALLQTRPEIQIIGEASNGREAVEKTRELRPDVVLMDVSMPEMNGFDATRVIKEEMPQVRVVGFSVFVDSAMSSMMDQAGADALLTKGGPIDALFEAIRGSR